MNRNVDMSEIGVLRKHHLELINNKVGQKTQMNQWRNMKSVIE